MRRRSRATELPDRNAKLLGLVGEVRRDARAGEYNDADWEDVEYLVVAFERRGPEEIRTPDPQIRSLLPRARKNLVIARGSK